ncbi:hypothetical protein RDWZM_005457 [Blomia tropicalis]|uniref:Uncharacterized protein n=1 Tax=Blomia tropicalis TaxID=40697 RepID=A0A9Q0M5M9_BLOTA|nr:hypothetical protein RDWZM_005457 [Blomia tropicalis]
MYSKKDKTRTRHKSQSSPKYAATMLVAPKRYPKMNRYQRPSTKYNGDNYRGKVLAQIPIKSRHHLMFREYPLKAGYKTAGTGPEYQQIVEVNANSIPLNLVFMTQSSKVNVKQEHKKAFTGNYPQHSYSIDEPHILKHTVTKPIYQEIREIIHPTRKIVQQIEPVQEEIHTTITTTGGQMPAMLNEYQPEPVLYGMPKGTNEVQPEYKTEPKVESQANVEEYKQPKSALLVSQFVIEQQVGQIEHLIQPPPALSTYEQQVGKIEHLIQPPPALSTYENVQPMENNVHSSMPVPVQVSAIISAQPEIVNVSVPTAEPIFNSVMLNSLYSETNGKRQPIPLPETTPMPSLPYPEPVAGPVPAPFGLVADGNLLDAYLKYSKISPEDLLLPVYQAASPIQVTEHYSQTQPIVPIVNQQSQSHSTMINNQNPTVY